MIYYNKKARRARKAQAGIKTSAYFPGGGGTMTDQEFADNTALIERRLANGTMTGELRGVRGDLDRETKRRANIASANTGLTTRDAISNINPGITGPSAIETAGKSLLQNSSGIYDNMKLAGLGADIKSSKGLYNSAALAISSKLPGEAVPGRPAGINPITTDPGEINKGKPIGGVTNEQLLKALDGKLEGAKTPEAIEALQAQLKVPVDGKWGPISQEAFNRARRGIYLQTTEGKEADGKIKRIQRRLGVKVDGIWGVNTSKAFEKLKALQNDLEVKSDGIWGPITKKAAIKRSVDTHKEIKDLAAGIDTKPKLQTSNRPTNTLSNSEARKKARGNRRAARKEKRADNKAARELKRATKDTGLLRRGGLFYNTVEK